MSLNIKKPNYLNTSLINKDDHLKTYEEILDEAIDKNNVKHPFLVFKDQLSKSWKVKQEDLNSGNNLNDFFNKRKNIFLTPDLLKNKSLITYIDAPWGSGKTYFIENLIKWIKKEKDEEEFNFKKGSKPSKLNISVLDAWEIYNGSNIDEMLKFIFQPKINSKDLNCLIEKNSKDYIENNGLKTKEINSKIKRYSFISNVFLKNTPNPVQPLFYFGEKIRKELKDIPKTFSKELIKNSKNEFLETYSNKPIEIVTKSIIDYIEYKYEKNNNLIIIDNIERLSSDNRLDVVNKIINWANLSGTTYLFLTNFQKINFSSIFEEDFWNKISLHETFKLTNNWETYIKNYKRDNFDLSNNDYKDIRDFILAIIPSFFSKNNDNMDIREIKKLLDNWNEKEKCGIDNKSLIISLLKEIISKNLEGLDKYFLINHSISWLSENKWHLWEKDNEEIKKLLEEENIINKPLINNKMFRIQSNFYELKVILEKNKIVRFVNDSFKIKDEELDFFKKFNNFIDDNASRKFQIAISDILKTRMINNENNYIYKYMKTIKKDKTKIKYFEFKYNNIKKLHIYNDIF